MASSKQKTTWSKIQRESKLREKRAEKAARKEARKFEDPTAESTPHDEFMVDYRAAASEAGVDTEDSETENDAAEATEPVRSAS